MDLIGGGIDVGHHGVDGAVGIALQRCLVSGDRLEAADRTAEAEHMPVAFGHRFLCALRRAEAGAVGRGQPRQRRLQPSDPAPADVDLAQQQVCQHADEGQRGHDDHPGDARGGIAIGPQQDPRNDGQHEEGMDGKGDQRVAKESGHCGGKGMMRAGIDARAACPDTVARPRRSIRQSSSGRQSCSGRKPRGAAPAGRSSATRPACAETR